MAVKELKNRSNSCELKKDYTIIRNYATPYTFLALLFLAHLMLLGLCKLVVVTKSVSPMILHMFNNVKS